MIYQIKCINVGVLGLLFLFLLNITVSHSSSNVTKLEKHDQQINHCKNWQFQCKSGQCIANPFICDGLKDCKDYSDETYEQCRNKSMKTCDENFFQCNYGACIEKKYRCDGRIQCVDESDESPDLCKTLDKSSNKTRRNRRDTDSGCTIPESSADKTIKFVCDRDPSKDCKPLNGYMQEFTTATLTCTEGYFTEKTGDSSAHVCFKKQWSPQINKCLKKCEKLYPVNVIFQCYRDGLLINNCNENTVLFAGTTVRPSCKSSYRYDNPPNYFEITCNEDGKWDNSLLPCVADCGKPYIQPQLTISGGKQEAIGGSPWQVAIYNKDKVLICGGTIISQFTVISAAHCFSQGGSDCIGKDCAIQFEVMVGKYTSEYTKEDNIHQRKLRIREIRFPPKGYFGVTNYFAGDIAILILKDLIPISPLVLPACLNWANLKSGTQPAEGVPGKLSGWGRTENGTLSTTLRTLDLPFISHRRCIDLVDRTFKPFVTFDKICAGTGNKSGPTALDGDSGGGLLFEDRGLFYLQGVISIKSSSSNSVTVFTDLSEHTNWIAAVRKEADGREEQLRKQIVNDLKSRRFSEAEEKLIPEEDDIYYTAVQVAFRQGDNFNLLLNFGDYIDNRERKFKILNALYQEIIHSGENDVRKFIKVKQSLKKGILDRSTGALAAENVNRYLRDSIINAAAGPISSAFLKNDSWPKVKELAGDISDGCSECMVMLYKSVVDKIWNTVDLDDLLSRAHKNLKYLIDDVQIHMAVKDKLDQTNTLYTSSVITLAKHMKKTTDSTHYLDINSNIRSEYDELKNKLPRSVKNLVFSSKICIKNTKYNEYLYPGTSSDDIFKSKKNVKKVGHQAYTRRRDGNEQPNFKWRVLFWKKIQVKFRDDNFNENLYVTEDIFDDIRRNVITSNSTIGDEYYALDLDVDGDFIQIKDRFYQEYLFADLEKKKNGIERYVFSYRRKSKTPDSQWQIEDCS